ncbi:UDP-N-acetylmuramoyl-tripeptide--D-alanyl-D-alanine ligase [Flavobacteriaceae bacterium M23B6Z8]
MRIEELYDYFRKCSGVVTDSRKIQKNCLYISLKGDNFNGNQFAEEALEKGASYAVVDEDRYKTSDRILLADDGLIALQELARYHREKLKTPIISLTGSNGKTTTKELINAVLSKKYKTIATSGNLNNHIGVPLTLLRLQEATEMAVVEMGANHQKEIAFLCNIALPDYGLITNYGKAHLEGFGGVAGVIKGKSEMYIHLMKHQKFIFYHADDTIQVDKLNRYSEKKSFGSSKDADVQISIKESSGHFLALQSNSTTITTQLTGAYNLTNAAYAILIGKHFDVPDKDIVEAIENYVPENNRSQLLQAGSNQLILDAYNANPSSMKAALANLEFIQHDQKMAILGDMFELGPEAETEHQAIAEVAAKLKNTEVLLVGENFYKTNTPLPRFRTFEDARDYLLKQVPQQKTILIKGSRGMALERLLKIFES